LGFGTAKAAPTRTQGVFMMKTLLLASAAVLALSAGGAASAAPRPTAMDPVVKGHPFSLPSNLTTLYNQNSNDIGAVSSQVFTSGTFATYNDNAADDFTVPASTTWKVKEVDVTGQYSIAGPAVSENVIIYKNKAGKPGTILHTYTGIVGTDSSGSFVIPIPTTRLRGGAAGKTYWLSVQVNMNFTNSGQWYWGVNSTIHGTEAQWQAPGGGFGNICPVWNTITVCNGITGDLMFTLKGRP